MSTLASKLFGCAIAAASLLAAPRADARILFCNKFEHALFVAIAYPQQNGTWLSRGWLNVGTDECSEFDSALRVKTLFYRAESVPYRKDGKRMRTVWAKGETKFAIWERDNFNYWNAQTKILNSTLETFSNIGETSGDELSATVTFEADGINTTTTFRSR